MTLQTLKQIQIIERFLLTSSRKRSNAKDLDGNVRKPVKINQFGQIMRYDLIWLDSTVKVSIHILCESKRDKEYV